MEYLKFLISVHISYISHMVKFNFRIYTAIANNTYNTLK